MSSHTKLTVELRRREMYQPKAHEQSSAIRPKSFNLFAPVAKDAMAGSSELKSQSLASCLTRLWICAISGTRNKLAHAPAPLCLFCCAGGVRRSLVFGRHGRMREASPAGRFIEVEAVSVAWNRRSIALR